MPHLAALALVAVAAALAYATAPGGVLVFDARVLIAENPILVDPTADAVAYLLTHDYWQPMATDGLYRPLTTLSFLLDRAVLGRGMEATGYVVENVVLHVACASLVYALVWRLAGRREAATVAALLFALHPVATEAVTNVVGRADLLATAGVLGGVLAWGGAARTRGAARIGWTAALALATGVALFAKESGAALLAAVVLHDLAVRPARRVRAEHAVVALVTAGYLAARWSVASAGLPPADVSPIDNPIVEAPFWAGRATALAVLARMAGLVLWPATLSADYSSRQIPIVAWPPDAAGDWLAPLGLAGLAVAVWALVRIRRRDPAVLFLGAFALAALLPSSNLVVVIGSIMAERFLYMPLAGVAGVAGVLVDRAAGAGRRRALVAALVAIVALAYGVRTAMRNRDWRDERTLWAATVRAAPDSAKAHKAWAEAHVVADPDPASMARVVAAAEQAVALRPDYRQALVDLGGYYVTMGDLLAGREGGASTRWYEKAVPVLEQARTLDEHATAGFVERMLARGHERAAIPDAGDRILYNNLALAYVKLGRLEDALGAYQRLRALAPTDPALHRDVATILGALGRTDEAAVALFQAIELGDEGDAMQRLALLYREFAPAGEPIVTDAPDGGVEIHTRHPTVRRHRCRAWRELATSLAPQFAAAAAHAREQAAACGSE